MDEPILLIAPTDATKLWWEDGTWREMVEKSGLDRWRDGVASVLALAAVAGIVAVGAPPARWTEPASRMAPTPLPALATATAVEDGDRIARLEADNRRLYAVIASAQWKLAEIEVMRARMEATADAGVGPGVEPAVETADARNP